MTPRDLYKPGALLTLFALLAVAAYHAGLAGGYMYDDVPNIIQNPALHVHNLRPDTLLAAAFSSHAGPLMRPVAMLSFALDYYFFGLAPYSFKVTNLVIHLLNGALLFIFTLLALRGYRCTRDPAFDPRSDGWLAALVAGAWLLHPLNLTPVLYVVQRMASLAALFTIAALCVYAWGRLRMLDGRRGFALIVTSFLIFGCLSVLSKETGVLLPVYMLVTEVTLFRFRRHDGKCSRALAGFFIAALVVPGGIGLAWLLSQPHMGLGGYMGRDFTLGQRILTEPRVVLWYLHMIVAPMGRELGLYHDDIVLSHGLLNPPSTLASILVLLALVGAAVALLRRQPLISLGILWFFAGQLLESTVFPLLIAQEQRAYLADYGILLALFYLGLRAMQRANLRIFLRATATTFLALLCVTTAVRAGHWRNPVDQAAYEVAHHPRSSMAAYMLARLYANSALSGNAANTERAIRNLEKAARLGPGITPDVALVIVTQRLHRPTPQASLDDARSKLRDRPINPSDIAALKELTLCLQSECHIGPKRVVPLFEAALRSPHLERLKQRHADLLTIYGQYEINVLGNFTRGEELFRRAVAAAPRMAQYRINLINLLMVMGRYPMAERQLAALRKLNRFGALTTQIRAVEKDLGRAHKIEGDAPHVAPPT